VSAQNYLKGVDVSHYQGNIDWKAVKGSGISFAMAKATEGLTYVDPTFSKNWDGMRAAGLVRSAYHFGRPGSNAVDQARFFVHQIVARGGWTNSSTMPLVLDLEQTDGKSPAEVWAWVQAFMNELQRLTGKPGSIYVGYYFWTGQVGNPTNNLGSPLWIAGYVPKPKIPGAWKDWTFWQYTDKAKVPGIAAGVDGDYFKGTLAQLQAMCYGSDSPIAPTPAPTPTPSPMTCSIAHCTRATRIQDGTCACMRCAAGYDFPPNFTHAAPFCVPHENPTPPPPPSPSPSPTPAPRSCMCFHSPVCMHGCYAAGYQCIAACNPKQHYFACTSLCQQQQLVCSQTSTTDHC